MADSMREAMDAARPAYEAAQAKLAEQVKTCRHCKAAKTRARNAGRDDAKVMCKGHRERSRLNFVTSPVSETYWSS